MQWYQWLQLALYLAALGAGLYTLYLCYLDCWDATREWLGQPTGEASEAAEPLQQPTEGP